MAVLPPSTAAAAALVRSAMCRTTAAHRPAPSLFFYPGLTSKPFWDPKVVLGEDRYTALQASKKEIIAEYTQLELNQVPSDYSLQQDEHTLHSGKWAWHSYITKGKRQPLFAKQLAPKTASILDSLGSNLLVGPPFAYAFFSTLGGNTHIAPHFGPCNIRLRLHFSIRVPKTIVTSPTTATLTSSSSSSSSSTSSTFSFAPYPSPLGIQVGGEVREWKDDEILCFDDCYEHSVWNRTGEDRVVLLFDVWHPELSIKEREAINHMFDDARGKGWLK